MMKKFIVLMLVLGIASVASAGLALEIAGGSLVDNGVTWTAVGMDLIGTGSTTGPWAGSIGPDTYVLGTTILLANASVTAEAGNAAAAYADAYGGIGFDAAGVLPAGELEDVSNNTYPDADAVWFTISFDGVGLMDGDSFGIVAYNNATGWGSEIAGVVNVTPEPMTMALLGLGGLFLRRRK